MIQFIDLSRCTIERRGIQYIAQGLEYATSLKTLILNDCILKQPHTFDPLAHSVLHSHSLSRLSLRNITPFAAPWMSFLVAESGNSLTHLDLSGNNLHYTIGSLAHALKDNTAILELTLSNCQITHEGLTYLAEALVGCI